MAGTNRILVAYKDTTMSNERFNDEVLSAIIDGEADADTVASVNADAGASARLEQLRSAVDFVASPAPDATPERRSASIAAAMAAAQPAPEISSLAAARHERDQTKQRRSIPPLWFAAAAAMLLFIVAIPLLVRFSPGDAETASTDTSGDASLNVTDSASDGADAVDDSADIESDSDDAADAPASADEAGSDDAADEPMEEEAPEENATPPTTAAVSATIPAPDDSDEGSSEDRLKSENFFTVNNVDSLDSMINIGSVQPEFSAGDAIIAGVNPDCVRPNTLVTTETPYALINLTPFAGDDRLIYVEFADDGTTRILEAEDCAPLR